MQRNSSRLSLLVLLCSFGCAHNPRDAREGDHDRDHPVPSVGPAPVGNAFAAAGEARASSQGSEASGPGAAVDGDLATAWEPAADDDQPWLTVELDAPRALDRVELQLAGEGRWVFVVEGSVDGIGWATVVDRSRGAVGRTFAFSASGTYRQVRLTVLEAPTGASIGVNELLVTGAADGVNLAAGRRATATTALAGFPPAHAIDGDDGTYWVAASGSLPQAITVDLGAPAALVAVEQRYKDVDLHRFRIEGSLDGVGWTLLLDASAGQRGQRFRGPASGSFRYVRLTILGSAAGYWAGSSELRVLGVPGAGGELPVVRELARGAKATSTSLASGHEPFRAVDGDPATSWISEVAAGPQAVTIDLGNASLLTRVEQDFVSDDTYRFEIEGSIDQTAWTSLLDHTAGVSGRVFGADVSGRYRYVRLTVGGPGAAHGSWPASQELRVFGVGSPRTTRWWQESGGVMRYYPVWQQIKLTEITAQLDALRAQGFQALELAPVFQGIRELWAGLSMTDPYKIHPDIGTMEDYRALLAAAHARDMKILFFANPGYAHTSAPMFMKAEDDFKAGVQSVERSWFDIRPAPAEFDRWRRSDRANGWFWGFWDPQAPSFDFGSADWRAECRRYLRFWMDVGVDGIVLDAPEAYHHISVERNNEAITDVLANYDPFMNSEGASRVELIRDWHYNSLQDYTVTWWGIPPAQGGSAIINAIESGNPRGLENVFKGYRDIMVNAGGITQTPPNWGRTGYPAQRRLLEIATLTTMGTLFYLHNDYYTILPHEQEMPSWSAEERAMVDRLVRAQGSHGALSPSGLRFRVPTQDDDRFYAYQRTDVSGALSALVVLNFQPTAESVTVDLEGAGVAFPQVPVDLLHGGAAAPIGGASYTVALPPFGFAVLGLNALPAE